MRTERLTLVFQGRFPVRGALARRRSGLRHGPRRAVRAPLGALAAPSCLCRCTTSRPSPKRSAAPCSSCWAAPDLRGQPAAVSPVRPHDAHRRLPHPAARDRPDPRPPAPRRDPRPPLRRAAAAPDGSPHEHLGVSRLRPRLRIPGAGGSWAGRQSAAGPGGARSGPRDRRAPAVRRPDQTPRRGWPPPHASWTARSPSSTLRGPIEIPRRTCSATRCSST